MYHLQFQLECSIVAVGTRGNFPAEKVHKLLRHVSRYDVEERDNTVEEPLYFCSQNGVKGGGGGGGGGRKGIAEEIGRGREKVDQRKEGLGTELEHIYRCMYI